MGNLNELMTTRKINTSYSEELEVILNALKKNELKSITDSHGLKGCSSLNKAGLAGRIIEAVTDVNQLKEAIDKVDEDTRKDIFNLAHHSFVAPEGIKGSEIGTLINLGYIYLAVNEADIVLTMPEVIKETYRKIESIDEFQDEELTNETSHEEVPGVETSLEVIQAENDSVELSVEEVPSLQEQSISNLAYVPARTLEGKIVPIQVIKVGRNESCPCESGKKYKKCCGR